MSPWGMMGFSVPERLPTQHEEHVTCTTWMSTCGVYGNILETIEVCGVMAHNI